MDTILDFIKGAILVPTIAIGLLVVATIAYFIVKARWKTAKGNEVLVISGTPSGVKAIMGGGRFVSPLYQVSRFTTSVLMLQLDGRETPTKDKIQVVVNCTAQIAPDDSSEKQLIKAFQGYYGEYSAHQIVESLQETLMGALRTVIGDMTPEQLLHEKDSFNQRVTEDVATLMEGLGFKLKSLNLGDVTDRDGYIEDLSARERESKREIAANTKAESKKNIAVVQAEATRASEDARITSELAVDERKRDAAIKRSGYQAEQDVARADAEVAGELRRSERSKEVATREGEVAVVREQQRQKAAEARRAVEMTDAETQKQTEAIQAEAAKQQAEIAAAAKAKQDEIAAAAAANVSERRAAGEAKAAEARAKGVANAEREQAKAKADAINLTADAEADKVRKTGLAAAEVKRAEGEAEAAAILAKGTADAEAQRLMAEALAANDGANLRVTLAEVESRTRISVATALGTAMHEVGTNATIVDMGGSGSSQGGILGDLLGSVPKLLMQLDVQSEALKGKPFGEAIGDTLAGVANGSSSTPSASAIEDAKGE